MRALLEQRDQALERARGAKEAKVADARGRDANTDIFAVVEGWRGGEHIITAFPMHVGQSQRDPALRAAHALAVGFGCDTMAVTLETRKTTTKTSPLTGKDWAEGEMELVALEHDGYAKGWVVDCLVTFVVNRAGDIAAGFQSYRLTRTGYGAKTTRYGLEWVGTDLSEGAQLSGIIPRNLVRSMNQPDVGALMAREFGDVPGQFGLDHEEAMAHRDCGVVKALKMGGFTGALLLSAAPGSKRQDIIRRSLEGLGEERAQ